MLLHTITFAMRCARVEAAFDEWSAAQPTAADDREGDAS